MKKYFLALAVVLYSCFSLAQCPSGDVNLYDQGDVEEFLLEYATCEVITGDLLIGSDVSDISGITNLKRIEGSLKILYSQVESIYNFTSLEYIGGDLSMRENHQLLSLEGPDALKTIGGDLSVYSAANLTSITGFNNLETVGGNFELISLFGLERIGNFDKLTHVDGWFAIGRHPLLKEIRGFNSLLQVGDVYSVESAKGGLQITLNDALTSIDGFHALEVVVRNLELSANPKLTTLKAFSSLKEVAHEFILGGSQELREIPDFPELGIVGGMEFINLGVSVVDGFNKLEQIAWNVTIYRNEQLTAITGFRNLVEIDGQLDIITNENLQSLAGFGQLSKIKGLNIQQNGKLEDLHGLENLLISGLVTSNGVTIRDNASLSDCSAICNLLTNGTVYGDINIGFNPSLCSSEQEVRKSCIPDFDDDGILDDDDLDDDNDGIKDSLEQAGLPDRDTDKDAHPDSRDLDSDNDGCPDVIEAGFDDPDANGRLGAAPEQVDEKGLVVGTSDGYTPPLDSDRNGLFDFQENSSLSPGRDSKLTICSSADPFDLFEALGGAPDPGGTWKPSPGENGLFDPSKQVSGTYTYTLSNGICGEASARMEVEVIKAVNAGKDGHLELCAEAEAVDFFELLGPDAGASGSWTPSLAGGGSLFDPALDPAGTYTYTLDNGLCEPDTSRVVISLLEMPDPGADASISLSSKSAPVSLFESLGGDPDSGGSWSPGLSGGGSMFDPARDQPGVYTYSLENDKCGTRSAEVTVKVTSLPHAGEDSEIKLCEKEAPVNLLQQLKGTPDEHGSWSPPLSGGNAVFDPFTDPAGTYMYTVTNETGQTDTSVVMVSVAPLPDPGGDSSLEICINAAPTDLFSHLQGAPQPDGSWSPALASGKGIFDPAVDPAGTYTYSVSNPCGTAVSRVSVIKTELVPIDAYEIRVKEFGEDNSISVQIFSDRSYEYSLDGSSFQGSSTFSGLPGGTFTLYVREVNGCGRLQKTISIVAFPQFFSPNKDGHNDRWNIRGDSGKQVRSIRIFDRYGKLLATLDPESAGWDGTYNGKAMPADDYWFHAELRDQAPRTGHFSLIR